MVMVLRKPCHTAAIAERTSRKKNSAEIASAK
jgi:hypothetical protein